MTTIAFHKDSMTIAVDSRETMGSLIASDKANKVERIKGEYYVLSGDVLDCDLLLESVISGASYSRDLEANIMFTKNGKVFNSNFFAEGGLSTWEVKRNYAMGSGESFALAAMDFKCNAKDAVKYAITRDIYSGGKVHVIKVK